jgi:hypothetical protein
MRQNMPREGTCFPLPASARTKQHFYELLTMWNMAQLEKELEIRCRVEEGSAKELY